MTNGNNIIPILLDGGHLAYSVRLRLRSGFLTVRIDTAEHAAHSIVWSALYKFLPDNPDVQVKVTVDYGLTGLVRVLEDWCPSFPNYHVYYPSRWQSSPVLKLVIDALRQGI